MIKPVKKETNSLLSFLRLLHKDREGSNSTKLIEKSRDTPTPPIKKEEREKRTHKKIK